MCAGTPAEQRGPQKAGGGLHAAPPTAGAADAHGVTVEAQFTVGEYEVVILSAKDAAGLETWLNEQKYKTSRRQRAVLPSIRAGGAAGSSSRGAGRHEGDHG